MTWEDIIDKQAQQYKAYLQNHKQFKEQLQKDKEMFMEQLKCKEQDLPESIKEKLNRDAEDWKERWGMYGSEFKNMRIAHQKEVDNYFRRNEIVKDLSTTKEKGKEKER